MKVVILVALALCAFAHAGTVGETRKTVEVRLGAQQLDLHGGSDVFTEQDRSLGELLTALEKAQGRNAVADAIAQALEDFRDVVINGNDDIPPLDPLHIDQLGPFEQNANGIVITAGIRQFNMEGLRHYVVDHVTFNALRLSLGSRITIPSLMFTGSYDASARISFLQQSASGNYWVLATTIRTSLDMRIGTNILGGGSLFLREFEIQIVIDDITVQLSGQTGSSILNNLIESLVQNAMESLLGETMEELSQSLSAALFDVIDEFLRDFTLDDLLG